VSEERKLRQWRVGCKLSLTTKIVATLLMLGLCATAMSAPIGDLRVPLELKSRFVIRAEEGPPTDCMGLNKCAPVYLFKFTKLKYRRDISFSPNGDYIYQRDYYGSYMLPSFQAQTTSSFIAFRRGYAFNDTWMTDLRQAFGKATAGQEQGAVQFNIPWEPPAAVKSIIGEGKSNIRVTGSRSIQFSGKSEWEDGLVNTGTFKQSKFPTLQMEQKSQFKVTGTIGSKITVEVDQDSQRNIDLANTIKLRYKGDENEIIQSIEAGNTTLSLPNAQFIGYSQNVQGLFGIKATAKIGNLDLTMITSQEKGSSEKANFSAGAKGSEQTIKDYSYLPNTYFWLKDFDQPWDPADSLTTVELYIKGVITDPRGIAVVNPNDSLPYISPEEGTRNEVEWAPFVQYDPSQFVVNKQSWYVVLNRQLQSDDILGAYYKYTHYVPAQGGVPAHHDTLVVGNLRFRPNSNSNLDTTFVLKLLKYHYPNAGLTTWNRMMRNVYDLGARNISSEGFDLKIYHGKGTRTTDPESQNGHCFITLLGLDHKNNSNNTAGADCIFDFDNTMVDASRGHLIFPMRFPFISDSLLDNNSFMYTESQSNSSQSDSSQYYIYVKTSQRSSTFSLNRANIMPNSEVVKLGDGTVLRRDIDYTINYDIGQITFLNDQALNPAANVSVDYEFAPFFMPEKKSLFGFAGQYKFWENSNISMAAMYRSENASDPRPKVGHEPNKGFIWDSNFSFNFKPDLMTHMIDALPLIEADAPSSLELSGEIAESFPNPNTKNEAYIDDFEGSRSYTDLSTRRGIWTVASPPLDSSNAEKSLDNEAKMWWYNPQTPLTITQIWPERQVKAQDNRIDVMFLHYFPDTTGTAPESSWAGIMRPLYAGLADQTLTKFIEMWYYDSTLSDDNTVLNIDLGAVSEDLNDNQLLDSEDRQRLGTAIGVFEPDSEDTGLDGVFNAQEGPAFSPIIDSHGDDWSYVPGTEDYSHINGTEKNNNDPDRMGRFDTEDINNNSALDKQNGYFEFSIRLNDPRYVVDSTSTRWRLLRIPFQDSTIYRIRGDRELAGYDKINFARLWMTGGRHHHQLVIASLELVGNKWRELPIAFPTGDTLRPDENFEIAVKNTQENSSYYSPPGVAGNLNRDTGIREKEQSLALSYTNMAAGHVGGAYWSLYNADDYTQYQKLKMYVHGDSTPESGVTDGQMTFFLRLSQDGTNFYEYHSVLEPGWTQNNWVEIDFAKLTDLKYELQQRTKPESLAYADTSDGHYRIHGNPSLSQVRMFIAGVEVNGQATSTYTGEVWIDELRVTDVRRKSDFAERLQATARFSDFVTLGLTYNRNGADFFPLGARTSVGSTTVAKGLRLDVKADKLLPPSLGFSLPISFGWQSSVALPRLKTGSDIILNQAASNLEKTENNSFTYSINEAFSRNTKSWLWNLTLNKIRTSYTFSRADGPSPTNPVNRRDTYRGSGNYDLSPQAKPSFRPFFWTKYLFLPKAVSDTRLYYLPTQLSFSSEVNGSKAINVTQNNIQTSSRTRDLSLTGNAGISPFNSLRLSYNANSSRDISQPGQLKLSINPSKLKLGKERSFQQRFETGFQPKIIRLIDNRFTFNSTYSDNSDLQRNPDTTRAALMTSTVKAEITFNIQNLLPASANKPIPKEPKMDKGQNPDLNKGDDKGKPDKAEPDKEQSKTDDQDTIPKGSGIGFPRWTLRQFANFFRSIKPIRASYQNDKKFTTQGLRERPGWQYQFGLAENPRVPVKTLTGLGNNQTVFSDNYLVDTGLQPGHGLDITTGYTLRKTVTYSSNEPVSAKSVTFPDVTITLSGLEKIPLFSKFSSSVGLQSSYNNKVDENGRADTGELYKRDTAKQWAPLAAITINLKNNVRTTLRYDKTTNISQNLKSEGQSNRDTQGSDNAIKLSLTYSLTAPQGLKLPLLKRIKFNSQLSMNLDITIRSSKSESTTSGVKSIDSQKSQMTIEPHLNYQFSRSITGGIRGRWDDSNDKISKRKHHIRELGLTAEIRF
jgi:hypothetical protein